MNQDTNKQAGDKKRTCSGRLSKGTRIGIGAAALIGVGALVTVLVGTFTHAWAGTGFRHHGNVYSIEEARDRAKDVSAWLSGTVDASDAQRAQVDTILIELAETLYPLAEQHRGHKRDLLNEISRPEVTRDGLEQIRQAEIGLADEGSSAVIEAFMKVSEVLEPEQRQELIALAAHLRHRMGHRGKWHHGDGHDDADRM